MRVLQDGWHNQRTRKDGGERNRVAVALLDRIDSDAIIMIADEVLRSLTRFLVAWRPGEGDV